MAQTQHDQEPDECGTCDWYATLAEPVNYDIDHDEETWSCPQCGTTLKRIANPQPKPLCRICPSANSAN